MQASLTVIRSLGQVAEEEWDALVPPDDPFCEHAFLAHLEESGAVGVGTGWAPVHLLLRDPSGRLIGAAPMYLKDNSHGEYIFDWGWADAAWRSGIPYYPKLVSAVPFTPATGSRLLVRPGMDAEAVRLSLAEGALEQARHLKAHSVHWLFVPPDEIGPLVRAGYARRSSWQYHLSNPGWRDFDDMLEAMNARRRKEIRRERRLARELGLDLAVESVATLSDGDLRLLYLCYRSTTGEHHAIDYLTERWFLGLRERLGHRALVATARRGGRLVAAALAFARGHHLYGRYWGALEPAPMLHFELCYYQFVEYAITHGMTRVEAGAQGEHKIPRGFLPSETLSAHRLMHPGLEQAVRAFLLREEEHVRQTMAGLAGSSPFRAGPG